ncbi:MAG: hypothetical protein CUN55_09845 [Phototrophicales bacterium]|nr:MAG: hypothetical protein CUN55_09845 [Phototrophicales bacterium]
MMILKRFFVTLSLFAITLMLLPSTSNVLAQDSELPKVIASEDGLVSLRVPDGWLALDSSNDPQIALFTTQLWFGDSEDAINTRLEYNRNGSGTVVGLGGGAFLTNEDVYQQAFGEAPTAQGLIEVLSEFNRNAGFTVDELTEVTVNGHNGFFTIIDSTSFNDERSLVVTLDTPNGVALVLASGTSSNVAENAELLVDIANTFQTPAEQTTTPASDPTAGTGGPTDYTITRTISDPEGRVSIQLPSAWFVENHLDEPSEAIIFGESPEAISSRVEDFEEPGGGEVIGVGGSIAFIDMGELGIANPTPENYAVDLLADIAESYVQNGAEILVESTPFEVYGNNAGALLGVQWPSGQTGWASFLTIDQANLAIFVLLSAPSFEEFNTQYVELASLIDTIRAPAEADAITIPPVGQVPEQPTDANNGTQGPGLGDIFNSGSNTGAAPPSTNTSTIAEGYAVYRANDNSFSIQLPEGWVIADTIASNQTLIIAESDAALSSRQDELDIIGRTTPVQGSGVTIIPYVLSDFATPGQVPAQFALNAVTNLSDTWTEEGGLVVFPPAELLNENGVQIAWVGGINNANGEAGFAAFAIFEDANLALYINATSESSAAFTEDVFMFETAIKSVKAPAE